MSRATKRFLTNHPQITQKESVKSVDGFVLLTALLKELRDQAGPTRLMARADA